LNFVAYAGGLKFEPQAREWLS